MDGLGRLRQDDLVLETIYDAVGTLLLRGDLAKRDSVAVVTTFFQNVLVLAAQLVADEVPHIQDCVLLVVGDVTRPYFATVKRLNKAGEVQGGLPKDFALFFEAKRGVDVIVKRFKSGRYVEPKFARVLLDVCAKVAAVDGQRPAV